MENLIKVFERVLRKQLIKHLEDQGHLPNSQHGFRAFRSTLTQLLTHWDTILTDMEEGKGVDIIYTDFSYYDTIVVSTEEGFDKIKPKVL